jgi:hypothetical protein
MGSSRFYRRVHIFPKAVGQPLEVRPEPEPSAWAAPTVTEWRGIPKTVGIPGDRGSYYTRRPAVTQESIPRTGGARAGYLLPLVLLIVAVLVLGSGKCLPSAYPTGVKGPGIGCNRESP